MTLCKVERVARASEADIHHAIWCDGWLAACICMAVPGSGAHLGRGHAIEGHAARGVCHKHDQGSCFPRHLLPASSKHGFRPCCGMSLGRSTDVLQCKMVKQDAAQDDAMDMPLPAKPHIPVRTQALAHRLAERCLSLLFVDSRSHVGLLHKHASGGLALVGSSLPPGPLVGRC